MEFVREGGSIEIATTIEARRRRRLEKRMTLFQSEIAKLPEIERLRMSAMLSETLIDAIKDMHIAAVTLNGIYEGMRTTTPEARAAADQRGNEAIADAIELYKK